MAVVSLSPRRAIIVGAGASFPYLLPLAGTLLEKSVSRISDLAIQYRDLTTGLTRYSSDSAKNLISQDDPLSGPLLNSIPDIHDAKSVATIFQETLVQQNLDDFVRDHPSLTNVVTTLIATELFSAIYKNKDYRWEIRGELKKGGTPLQNDWMRQFVGTVRPLASANNKLSIISFNYDYLLERSMKLYWAGAETAYDKLDDAVSFIYPHGRFSELPDTVSDPAAFISKQASNLRVGELRDEVAIKNAKEAVQQAAKIFSIGFSFSNTNIKLLGFDRACASRSYIQNFENKDIRLLRKLEEWQHPPLRRDYGDMGSLVTNGFFEQ